MLRTTVPMAVRSVARAHPEARGEVRPSGHPIPVVMVHGLWFSGRSLALLGRRLGRPDTLAGQGAARVFQAQRFEYGSVSWPAARTLDGLATRIRGLAQERVQERARYQAQDLPQVHIVCHSLGGLVVRQLLVQAPELPIGRIVTLGTPHAGSRVARRLARYRWGRALLGHSLDFGLDGTGLAPLPDRARPQIGALAGSLPLGLGQVLGGFGGVRHDGTVAVDETRSAGLADHLTLRVSHLGMLVSPAVAAQVRHFLVHGRFMH